MFKVISNLQKCKKEYLNFLSTMNFSVLIKMFSELIWYQICWINNVKIRIRQPLILLILLLSNSKAYAQQELSANRYLDAYKDYLDASCPIPKDDIKHFVYFARDRSAIENHAFLNHPRFEGAQIMYPWVHLERGEGKYDFSIIEADLSYLQSNGKKLFIQLQDATFDPDFRATPSYLHTEYYDHGDVMTINEEGVHEGWVAKRWNKKVRHRFSRLLQALGSQFDGRIEGINLQETAIDIEKNTEETFPLLNT